MITLLTGVPGTGKTSFAVNYLSKAQENELAGRPIYTNITGLKLEHHPVDVDWLRDWHKNAPQGAYIVIDECQDIFPPRHASKEPPVYISELAKHRKDYGVDFFLITQQATFIDHTVRGHVARYLHIRENGLTKMIHEAPEVVNFSEKSVRETNISNAYSIQKTTFDLYTSAPLHTKKPRKKLPNVAYIFGFALLLAAGIAYKAYSNISEKLKGGESVEAADGGLPPSRLNDQPAVASFQVRDTQAPFNLVEAMTPKDPENPLSAPIYKEAKPEVVAPRIEVCISSAKSCICYSQQQTPIWVPDTQCRNRAAGKYYDPYQLPQQSDHQLVKRHQPTPPQDMPRSLEVGAPPSGSGVS